MKKLEKKAQELRIMIIQSLAAAGSGHPGGSLSAIDILTNLILSRNDNQYAKLSTKKQRSFCFIKRTWGAGTLCSIADKGFFQRMI